MEVHNRIYWTSNVNTVFKKERKWLLKNTYLWDTYTVLNILHLDTLYLSKEAKHAFICISLFLLQKLAEWWICSWKSLLPALNVSLIIWNMCYSLCLHLKLSATKFITFLSTFWVFIDTSWAIAFIFFITS